MDLFQGVTMLLAEPGNQGRASMDYLTVAGTKKATNSTSALTGILKNKSTISTNSFDYYYSSTSQILPTVSGISQNKSVISTVSEQHPTNLQGQSNINRLSSSQKPKKEEEKPNYVSFGTTASRPVFPMAMPPTRFGNEIKPIRGQPNTGPGAYENENQTNFQYKADHYLTSNKGYTMGARTGPRFRKEFLEETPAPDQYQTKCTDPIEFSDAYKPFNYEAERFPVTRKDIEEATPGAGSYEHGVSRNRHVQWHQSFGGAPIKLPDVHIKSTIGTNTAKLLSTRDAKKHHRRLAYLKLYWE